MSEGSLGCSTEGARELNSGGTRTSAANHPSSGSIAISTRTQSRRAAVHARGSGPPECRSSIVRSATSRGAKIRDVGRGKGIVSGGAKGGCLWAVTSAVASPRVTERVAYTDAHVARPVLAVAYSRGYLNPGRGPQAVTWRGYRLARNGQSERDCQWATVQQR